MKSTKEKKRREKEEKGDKILEIKMKMKRNQEE